MISLQNITNDAQITNWFPPPFRYEIYTFCYFQECDQVHIDDVSSDDNGQDLT